MEWIGYKVHKEIHQRRRVTNTRHEEIEADGRNNTETAK